MYFTENQVTELNDAYHEVHRKFVDLRERYIVRNYQNTQAKEYATYGFARRLGILIECIDNVLMYFHRNVKIFLEEMKSSMRRSMSKRLYLTFLVAVRILPGFG